MQFNVYFCVALGCLVTFQGLTLASQTPQTCTLCSTQLEPVCGLLERSGQKIYQTFGNECLLRRENCLHSENPYAKKGVVGKTCAQQQMFSVCSKACYFLYRPVCGLLVTNGQKVYRTFSNDCTFWQANCQSPKKQYVQLGHDGQSCADLGYCPKICPALELPVCGLLHSEGSKVYKTFGNRCLLEQENCRNPKTPYVQIGAAGRTCAAQGLVNQCAHSCSKLYEPRCTKRTLAFEFVQYYTFWNNCYLVQYNCNWPQYAFHVVGEVGKTCWEQRGTF